MKDMYRLCIRWFSFSLSRSSLPFNLLAWLPDRIIW